MAKKRNASVRRRMRVLLLVLLGSALVSFYGLRLVTKGAVETEADGRRFLYTPTIARADYIGNESRRLVDRLFGGRPASLFAQLAESEALSDQDLAEIERLLKELKS